LTSEHKRIRSFIAIELPGEIKSDLSQLGDSLMDARHPFVKWVDFENIHLTLKFLGNVAVNQITEITEAMGEAIRGVSSFRLEISGLGAFPRMEQPRVIWVGISGETDKLSELQRRVDSKLVHLGFARENQSFVPHLTLARVRDGASSNDRKDLGRLLTSTKFESKGHITVNSINLMKSQLTPDGPIYSRLFTVSLQSK
jgi:2'-5' RNA ligase